MAITILSYGCPLAQSPCHEMPCRAGPDRAGSSQGHWVSFPPNVLWPQTGIWRVEGAPQSAEHLRIQHSSVQKSFNLKVFAIVQCRTCILNIVERSFQCAGLVGMVSAGAGDRRGNDKLIYIFLQPTNCPNILTKVKWYGIDDLYRLTCECSTN